MQLKNFRMMLKSRSNSTSGIRAPCSFMIDGSSRYKIHSRCFKPIYNKFDDNFCQAICRATQTHWWPKAKIKLDVLKILKIMYILIKRKYNKYTTQNKNNIRN